MTERARTSGFDPSARLSTLDDGSQYLGARDRLLWFLGEHDEYSVASHLEQLTNSLVIVKVTVATGSGKKVEALGSATTGGDYRAVETAETHALARALALLGYGTESALGLDARTMADSPAMRPAGGDGKTPGNGQEGDVENLPAWARLPAPAKSEDKAQKASGEAPGEQDSGAEAQGARGANKVSQLAACSDCQGRIREGKTRDGTLLTAVEVAQRAQKLFGRPLCASCITRQMLQRQGGTAR